VAYWRKSPEQGIALQDVRRAQRIASTEKITNRVVSPLQEIITAQPAVLLGLIAHLVSTPLQDDIVRATQRLLRIGQDILAASEAPTARPAQIAERGEVLLPLGFLVGLASFVRPAPARIFVPTNKNLQPLARRACQGWPRFSWPSVRAWP